MKITVFGGARAGKDPAFMAAAEELGGWLARRGDSIVYGGGHVGMMGALADAALAEGGEVIGVIPDFMMEREWGHTGISKMHVTDSMEERKIILGELGEAFIAMPGGTGTLDEIAEMISLGNLGLMEAPCYFLSINGYYEPLRQMLDRMVEQDYMGEAERRQVVFVDSVAELGAYL